MAGSPHRSTGSAARLPQLGLRRVGWVRVVLDADGPRCQVVGTSFRLPVVRDVPVRTAAALLAAGVPGVVRSPVPGTRDSDALALVERAR
ncbi:MAG: hypothetical protein M3Q48_01430 [Actinomycetota bacterium]|nr:hypothetical protein [Actinomycetota bacterium]